MPMKIIKELFNKSITTNDTDNVSNNKVCLYDIIEYSPDKKVYMIKSNSSEIVYRGDIFGIEYTLILNSEINKCYKTSYIVYEFFTEFDNKITLGEETK